MTNTVLHIDASPRTEHSVTRELSAEILRQLNADTVIRRDLVAPLPAIDAIWIGANFTPDADRSDDQKAILALSDELLAELEQADTIVIGAPMYNFSISTSLKTWIDLIARAGRSFRYTEAGPEGLMTGKRAIVAIATGGTPIEADYDYLTGYLKFILGFIGITDVTVIGADQVMAGLEEKMASAKTQIEALAA
ncbi:MAG: FMN-dependent NADH-azoreductase [Pseudooceanicola sp.]|jgi:FMN-dependent NADH-azoreductase|nr:FMN-dependent NADH-azoreductase [Pseudooceanicola sp.]|tara:strand:+ start:1093 stop:1674 length:582 start_codon:yes stop_codon:yes gene_type:complete